MKKLVSYTFLIIFLLLAITITFAEDNISTANPNEQNTVQTPTVNEIQTPSSTETQTTATDSETNSPPTTTSREEFNVKPGITPDNPVYFIKDTYQRFTVGNDPEKALDYREQKIAEAKVMVEQGKTDEANKVLDRALEYGDIVEKQVNPDSKSDVQERSEIVQNVIENLKDQTNNQETKNKFDENLNKEKEIGNAVELVSKINELCQALSKIDPLQYADNCKPKGNSPKWMIEQNKELTKEQNEQAKIFVEKLSQCFENPNNCDCKGMGVQSFEDFCTEKSQLAAKCKNGDETSCKDFQNSANPTEVLPDYLIPSFKQVESKYMKSEFDTYIPEECISAGAKTPETCNKVMFKIDSPKECIDAGLTGQSGEDEIKCREIMFQKNTPKECIDAGIDLKDKEAPRKCSKIMFAKYSAQECLDAGITGEGRDDQKKCNELLSKKTGESNTYAPKFNKDCNKISDTSEKMKCFEEFYNNAQVQIKDDFRQREMIDSNNGEVITPEEEKARQDCRNKGMDTILEHENGKRIIICIDKNMETQTGQSGTICQSQQQTENLRQDCKNNGQDSRVEMKGGCPWVMCVSNNNNNPSGSSTSNQNNQQISGGQKCPDGVCDSYEKTNPYACPQDCGGQSNQQQQNQPNNQQPDNQQPINRIDSPQQPNQQQNSCQGQPPSCPDGGAYCQNGAWVCPQGQQGQQPQQPMQPQQPQQEQQQPNPNPPEPGEQEQNPPQELQQEPSQPPAPTDSGTAPVTGGVIYIDKEEPNNNINNFLSYWWK